MNLFNFLKSTRGAIKPLNALLISGAAGAVFAYTVGTVSDKQIEAERQVRTLSSISAGSAKQGMMYRDGQLTSVHVRDSQHQLATAEERAAMQNSSALDRYMANQRALEGMDSSLGRAAQFAQTDGLNTGNREVIQTPGQWTRGEAPDTGAGVNNALTRATTSTQGNVPGGTERPTLAPAAMARASGSNSASSAGAISGGFAGGAATRGNTEGMRLSGAMPGGSNLLSQRGLDKGPLGQAGTSSFRNGRDSRVTRGSKLGRGKDELDDIAKRSARIAALDRPSANEGAQAFMGGTTRSGGVVVTNGLEGENVSSDDLQSTRGQQLKAVGNHLKGVENQLEERNKAHRSLIRRLLLTLGISLGMMATGMIVLNRFPHKNIWYWAISAALMGVVVAANAVLFNAANHFIHDYGKEGGTGMAWLAKILTPFMVAGMGYVILQPYNAWQGVKNLFNNIVKGFKKAFDPVNIALGSISNTVSNSLFGSLFKK